MKQSLHYTKILGVLSLLMLFAWGNVWAIDWSTTATTKENVTLTSNATIPENVTITIDGDLTISASSADVTLTVLGNLIVTGSITISGNSEDIYKKIGPVSIKTGTNYYYGILDMQGGNVVCGTWKIDGTMTCTGGGTLNLNDYSKLVNTSGTSYIKANKVVQSENAIVSYVDGTMNIIVIDTYTDNTTDAGNRVWDVTLGGKSGPYTQISETGWGEWDFWLRNNVNISITKLVYKDNDTFLWVFSVQDSKAVESLNDDGVNKLDETLWNKQSSLLPIELTSFIAEQSGDKVDIAWTTNSEVNNDFFTVEYSIDGVTFKTLEIVDGAGTTSEVQEYAISVDASLFTGVVYFRLKQTDFNGNYSYSDVIALTIESETEELIVYPNPATDYVTISGTITSAYVCDMYGKKIACSQNGNTFDVASLSVGTYYVVVTTESGKKVLPFVKK